MFQDQLGREGLRGSRCPLISGMPLPAAAGAWVHTTYETQTTSTRFQHVNINHACSSQRGKVFRGWDPGTPKEGLG